MVVVNAMATVDQHAGTAESTSGEAAPTAVSLFSGAGGMDLGFVRAGFNVLWANDFDKASCETHRNNLPGKVICGDITKLDVSQIPAADVIFGGPPCQGFSVAGKMDPDDPRSRLVWAFVAVVQAKQPSWFVMENVRALGMLEKWSPLRDGLLEAFTNAGYQVEYQVLNSAGYGVPQKRERVFFIGTRDASASIRFPSPADGDHWVSAREAIEDLPEAGTYGNEGICSAEITLARYPVMRRSPYAGMLVNGRGRPIDLDRPAPTMHASMGGNHTPIIDVMQLKGETDEPWVVGYHRRLTEGLLPASVEPPDHWRRITLQEAARFQGFPDDYVFAGARNAQFRQVGNAVPPLLAEAVAHAVKDEMDATSGASSNRAFQSIQAHLMRL